MSTYLVQRHDAPAAHEVPSHRDWITVSEHTTPEAAEAEADRLTATGVLHRAVTAPGDGAIVTVRVRAASTTSPTARACVSVVVSAGYEIHGYAQTREGVRTISTLKTGAGEQLVEWLGTLDDASSRRVIEIAAGPPGTYETTVIYPAVERLREFLALPPEARTASEARRRGFRVGYPGERHNAYPVITGLDGRDVRLIGE